MKQQIQQIDSKPSRTTVQTGPMLNEPMLGAGAYKEDLSLENHSPVSTRLREGDLLRTERLGSRMMQSDEILKIEMRGTAEQEGADEDEQMDPNGCMEEFMQRDLSCGGKCWICKPLHTPRSAAMFFVVYGILLILIGGPIFSASQSVVEYTKRYDNICPFNSECITNITLSEDMKAPVYIYYKISEMYQSHRRYTMSRNAKQADGEDVSESELESTCRPAVRVDGDIIVPCGLIASSVFNDTIELSVCGGGASCTRMEGDNFKSICWPSDKNKFKLRDLKEDETRTSYFSGSNETSYIIPPLSNERLITWMRPARSPELIAVDKVIENRDLKKGEELSFNLKNIWNARKFNAEKSIVITTMSWMGGKSDFLGFAYISVGATMIIAGLVMLMLSCHLNREPGEIMHFASSIQKARW
mmetsp:Transcript_8704/g.14133  ORF Transcript_8704/g.14133 Transcript_8704/m.14133 type:complete len:416 (-) Transcript_8704:110-1357(-)